MRVGEEREAFSAGGMGMSGGATGWKVSIRDIGSGGRGFARDYVGDRCLGCGACMLALWVLGYGNLRKILFWEFD